jgi:hypothetical protein
MKLACGAAALDFAAFLFGDGTQCSLFEMIKFAVAKTMQNMV